MVCCRDAVSSHQQRTWIPFVFVVLYWRIIYTFSSCSYLHKKLNMPSSCNISLVTQEPNQCSGSLAGTLVALRWYISRFCGGTRAVYLTDLAEVLGKVTNRKSSRLKMLRYTRLIGSLTFSQGITLQRIHISSNVNPSYAPSREQR